MGRFHFQKQPVPYKLSKSRRHKFTKANYEVTKWPEYNEALRRLYADSLFIARRFGG